MLDILKSFWVKFGQIIRGSIDGQSKKDKDNDLQKRVDELAILNRMSVALSSGQDLYHALRTFVKELKHVMVVDAFHIGLYDAQTDLFSYSLFLNLDEDLRLPPRDLRKEPGLTWEVITGKRILYLPDISEPNIQHTHNIVTVVEVGIRSYIGIPLMLQDRVIGVMSVQSLQANAYTPDQIRLLETLAANVAITLEKGVLIVQLQKELAERERSEQALRESESKLRAIIENVPFEMWLSDKERRYILQSGESVRLAGNIIGKTIEDLGMSPEITTQWKAEDEHVMEGKTVYKEAKRKVGGELRDFITYLAPVKDGEEIFGFVGISLDITERKNAEEALRESESKLRAIIENVPFDMWLSDKDNRYILQSGESYRMAGDIIGKIPEELGKPPEIVAQWKEEYQRAMNGETVYKEAAWEVDGEMADFMTMLAPVKDKDAIIGYVGINLDITERKHVETLLQKRAEEFETLYQTTQIFSQKTDLSSLLADIAERARLLLKADNGFLFLYDPQNKDLEYRVSTKIPSQGQRLQLGEGMAGRVAQTRQPMLLENYHTWEGRVNSFESWDIAAILGVPMLYAGTLIGVLGVENFAPNIDKFNEADAQLLSLFAAQAAAAVSNTSYVDQIRQNAIELENRVEERTTQLQESNQNLNQEKARLEQFNRQREIMSAMTDLLQASLTTEEASHIVLTHFKLLFPNRDGALHLTTSPNTFEPVAVWGEKKSLDVIYNASECWALRRGKPYHFGVGSPNPACAHVGKDIPQHALCIPLAAQGESLGNLHISTQNNQSIETIGDEDQKFIETIADSIALAIANLRLREKLHFESIRDGLTGLFNRRYLDETLPREIHRAERSKRPISILMFDIDHFKKINDTFGHDAGDAVLQSMAGLMLSGVRESDIACRYGGEEFTIILPDTPIEIAARRAEDLRKEASAMELHHNGQDLGKLTISIGVATYPEHGSTRDMLIKSADEAAYQAKEGGRNQVIVST